MDIVMDRVGVVGCGLMGAGIAEVSARAGKDVVVAESSPARRRGRAPAAPVLAASGPGAGQDRSAPPRCWTRITVVDSLDALADRDLVVEAIVENEPAKVELFGKLDAIVTSPNAILASNTSSIPIMKLAVATARPTHVIGVHFFNPVPVLSLVELVPSLLTAPDTTERARSSSRLTSASTRSTARTGPGSW